jgi:hypothetical protein
MSPAAVNFGTGEIFGVSLKPPSKPQHQLAPSVCLSHLVLAKSGSHSAEMLDECDEPGGEVHSYMVLRQGCGGGRIVVPVLCSNPLCLSCGKLKAWQERRRWQPVIMAMNKPRLISLTIPDGENLFERLEFFQKSFRRLLSLRLGLRNLRALEKDARDFAKAHYAGEVKAWEEIEERLKGVDRLLQSERPLWAAVDHAFIQLVDQLGKKRVLRPIRVTEIKKAVWQTGLTSAMMKEIKGIIDSNKITVLDAEHRLQEKTESVSRFVEKIIQEFGETGQWPMLRHKIGSGLARLEVTYGDELSRGTEDWHVHRHLCVDGDFIPWTFLCAAWLKVTDGQASVVDIRRLRKTPEAISEVIKYLTKPWEIPADLEIDFRVAMFGKKKIWPLGHAKPQDKGNQCPYCGGQYVDVEGVVHTCRARTAGKVNLVRAGNAMGFPYKIFETEPDPTTAEKERFVMVRYPDGAWREAPLLDTLRSCAALGRSGSGASVGDWYAELMAIKARGKPIQGVLL